MMDGAHPNELDLLAYVEDDLPDPRKAALAEHVAGCRACADSVRQLETARQVLRSAPLLELPAGSRAAVLAGLPARAPKRRLRWRPTVVAPALAAAAVLAVVGGVVLTADWNGDGREAQEAARPASPATVMQETAGGDAAGAAEDRTLSSALRPVQGPPKEVALYLRRQGFQARVVDSTVRVRNADPDAVMRALADRPSGPVVVEVVP
jgi:putative zinc finger protein